MSVIAWALLGYVVSSLRFGRLVRRGPDERLELIVHAVAAFVAVLISRQVGGPYEAGGCLVGLVTGSAWPFNGVGSVRLAAASAVGGLMVLAPFEALVGCAGAIVMIRIGRPRRLAITIGLLVAALLITFRGQPWPFGFSVWTVLVLVIIRRLTGPRAEAAPAFLRALMD